MSDSAVKLPDDFGELPHEVADLQMGLPLDASMEDSFLPEAWKEIMEFFERADPLKDGLTAVTEEAWREVLALYEKLKARGNHHYCPVIQRVLALSLDEDLSLEALAFVNTTAGCYGCH